jgi:hypothetical protein
MSPRRSSVGRATLTPGRLCTADRGACQGVRSLEVCLRDWVLSEGAIVRSVNIGFLGCPERLTEEAGDQRATAFPRPRQKLIRSGQ